MGGMTMQVICIVDRETHPQKTFGLSSEELDRIGQQCLKYADTVSGGQMPVTFQVMEVGAEPVTAEDRQRLETLKSASLISKVIIKAWKLDTTAGTA
jgi:rhomboid protease GluP